MTRPVRLLAALALALGLILVGAGAASAAPAAPASVAVLDLPSPCHVPVIGAVLAPACAVVGLGSAGVSYAASHVLSRFNPANIVETWAKDLGQAGAAYLGQVVHVVTTGTAPDFTAGWWTGQYATVFGLSCALFVVILAYVFARAAKADADGIALLRAAGVRAWLFLPLTATVPALLWWASGLSDDLAAAWAGGSRSDAATALAHLTAVMTTLTPAHVLGGVITLLGFGLVTTVVGFLLLVELAVRSFGLYLAGCVVPLAAAAAVNPAWKKGLTRTAGLLAGLLVTKPLVFLSFALMWGAAAHVGDGSLGHDLSTLLFVMVAAVLSCAAPALLALAAPSLAEGIGSGHGQARRQVGAPARGASSAETAARRASQWRERINAGAASARTSGPSSAAVRTGSRPGGTGAGAGSAGSGATSGAAAAAVPVAAAAAAASAARRHVTSSATRSAGTSPPPSARPGTSGPGVPVSPVAAGSAPRSAGTVPSAPLASPAPRMPSPAPSGKPRKAALDPFDPPRLRAVAAQVTDGPEGSAQ